MKRIFIPRRLDKSLPFRFHLTYEHAFFSDSGSLSFKTVTVRWLLIKQGCENALVVEVTNKKVMLPMWITV